MTRLPTLALPQNTLPSDLQENRARGVAQTGRFTAHDHCLTQTGVLQRDAPWIDMPWLKQPEASAPAAPLPHKQMDLTILSAECPATH